MNPFTKNYGCFSCQEGCKKDPCGKCGPAAWKDCSFPPLPSPFEQSQDETDTRLSTNYSNATLNYQAEKHTDILTGTQLGSLINLDNLRNVDADYDTNSMCYELIYHKYGDCGEGCQSIEDKWSTFSIDDTESLKTGINYVRGANVYGCPEYLIPPTNTNQYWFQGWRPNNKNGYFQPATVEKLPTDALGNYYVMSQDPNTKQPVVGTLPWQCLVNNIFGNLAINASESWRMVTGTRGFNATFNPMNGDFNIHWNDWNDTQDTQLAGTGDIWGHMNWKHSFNTVNGTMHYKITSVYFDKMTWTPVQGVTTTSKPTLHVWALPLPTGSPIEVVPATTFTNQPVNYTIDQTITLAMEFDVYPQQKIGPLEFCHFFLDWVGDDDGYLGINFTNNLYDWNSCQ